MAGSNGPYTNIKSGCNPFNYRSFTMTGLDIYTVIQEIV